MRIAAQFSVTPINRFPDITVLSLAGHVLEWEQRHYTTVSQVKPGLGQASEKQRTETPSLHLSTHIHCSTGSNKKTAIFMYILV